MAHNPTAGYITAAGQFDPWPLPSASARAETPNGRLSCPPPTEAQRRALAAQREILGQELGHCRLVELGLLSWRSDGALIPYFATLRKLFAFAAAILLAGLAWLWLVRDPTPRELRRGKDARERDSRGRAGAGGEAATEMKLSDF